MEFERCEAVLFDMDGVVIDTKKAVTLFWSRLTKRTGRPAITKEQFDKHVYGCQTRHTLDFLFPHLNLRQIKKVYEELEHLESNAAYTDIRGVKSFIRRLKNKGVSTALVTSAFDSKVDVAMKQLGIADLFDAYITASNVRESKPAPQCYITASLRLGKAPSECVVFEDAVSGVEAAKAAGAACIGIHDRPELLTEAGADFVFADFTDPELISLFFRG